MYYESFPLSFDEGLRLLLGGGGGRRHPIYYIIISNNFGYKWVRYSILWCSKFIYLDSLSHCVQRQNQIKCFEPLFKYDRF